MPILSPCSKLTAFTKAVPARITYTGRKGVHFSGEEGKERGATLLLFRKKQTHHKTTSLEMASEKVTTQGLVHPTA